MKKLNKDRNGEVHKSGLDSPNFGLDNPFGTSVSDGHDEDWEHFKSKATATARFNEYVKDKADVHLYKYNKDFGYEVIDSYSEEDEL